MKLVTEKFRDLSIEIKDLSDEAVVKNGENSGIVKFPKDFESGNEIILGFSPTNYHAFIQYGPLEIHPRLAFNRIKAKPIYANLIRAGLFIRLVGISSEEKNQLGKQLSMMVGKRTLSCIEGVRQALSYGPGITMNQVGAEDLYLNQVLYKLLKFGLKKKDGSKVSIEVYRTRPKKIERMFYEIAQTEKYYNAAGVLSYYLYKTMTEASKIKKDFASVVAPIEMKGPSFFNFGLEYFEKTPQ